MHLASLEVPVLLFLARKSKYLDRETMKFSIGLGLVILTSYVHHVVPVCQKTKVNEKDVKVN